MTLACQVGITLGYQEKKRYLNATKLHVKQIVSAEKLHSERAVCVYSVELVFRLGTEVTALFLVLARRATSMIYATPPPPFSAPLHALHAQWTLRPVNLRRIHLPHRSTADPQPSSPGCFITAHEQPRQPSPLPLIYLGLQLFIASVSPSSCRLTTVV